MQDLNATDNWWAELLATKTAEARRLAEMDYPRSPEKQTIFMDAFHRLAVSMRAEVFAKVEAK